MTDYPITFVDGNELTADELNKVRTNRTGDPVPIDNSTSNYVDNQEDLGNTSYRWQNAYLSKGIIGDGSSIVNNIFSIGNAKDGDASVTADYASGEMGGEYWFDTFEIDDDITVDDTNKYLIIRANTVTVSKSGGATISAVGVGMAGGSAPTAVGGTDQIATVGNKGTTGNGAVGGSGGSGSTQDSRTYATAVSGAGGDTYPIYPSLSQTGAATVAGVNGDSAGNAGNNGDAFSFGEESFMDYILIGAGGGSGSVGRDNDGEQGGTAGAGGIGGGCIKIYAKTLILTEDLTINTSGGVGGNGAAMGGENCAGGGGGGGGAGSNVLAYLLTSGSGTITQTSAGGAGGSGGANTYAGGDGGDGGDCFSIKYVISTNTITIS